MKRIMVVVTVHPEKVQDFDTKRQAEIAKIGEWKEKGILENFFIKSAFDGSVLIFKDVTLEEAKQYNSTLPFHPFMENIQYYELDKQF